MTLEEFYLRALQTPGMCIDLEHVDLVTCSSVYCDNCKLNSEHTNELCYKHQIPHKYSPAEKHATLNSLRTTHPELFV